MATIKRQTTTITDFKRGSNLINFIYRGTTLLWQRSATSIVVDYFNTSFNFNTISATGSYSTEFNIKNNEI